MTALGFLPFLTLILACVGFARRLGGGSTRRGVLRVALLWTAGSLLSLELLSLVTAVNFTALLSLWGVATMVLLVILVRGRRLQVMAPLLAFWRDADIWERSLAVGIVVLLGITALVAWLAPPNTWDSLNYHMPRVAHWAQLEAVQHFPTGIEIQNSMPPAAEMSILQSYILGQGDRWANFVAWFAMLGGLIGVSLVAHQLGAGRTGQWAAAAFAASLPTGIVQASSTMTDYVAAYFVLVSVMEVLTLRSYRGSDVELSPAYAVLAAGLALTTKPTALVFLAPFAVLAGFDLLKRRFPRRLAAPAFAGFGLVLIVAIPHLGRNVQTYGNPIGFPGHIGQHRLPFLAGRGPSSVLSRNLAAQVGTPSPHVNKGIARATQLMHEALDLEIDDPRTTVAGAFKVRFSSRNEDKATNPAHMWLILAAVPLGIAGGNRGGRWVELVAGAWLGFVLFSSAFKWNLFGGRLLHPFYVLMAPAVVTAFSTRVKRGWWVGGSALLLVAALPWLLQIKSRPILTAPGDTYIGSVLTTPRERLYFANGRYLEDPYTDLVARIEQRECRSVRLRLPGVAAEYPLWALLEAPGSEVQVGWSVAGSPSAEIAENLPSACAVICQDCPDGQASYGELDLAARSGGYSLYLAP